MLRQSALFPPIAEQSLHQIEEKKNEDSMQEATKVKLVRLWSTIEDANKKTARPPVLVYKYKWTEYSVILLYKLGSLAQLIKIIEGPNRFIMRCGPEVLITSNSTLNPFINISQYSHYIFHNYFFLSFRVKNQFKNKS